MMILGNHSWHTHSLASLFKYFANIVRAKRGGKIAKDLQMYDHNATLYFEVTFSLIIHLRKTVKLCYLRARIPYFKMIL